MRLRGRGSGLGVARAALLPPAAFAVHQLRYELAYGSHAGAELHATGHSYLHSAVPWLVMLIGLSVGAFLWRVAQTHARRATPREFRVSFVAAWALCAGALILVFFCQETLEGWFAAGHPSGLPAAFGDGGWWAVPVALAIGLVLAAVFHGARWVVCAVARRRQRAVVRSTASCARWNPREVLRPRLSPWLGGWSSRGPPARKSAALRAAFL